MKVWVIFQNKEVPDRDIWNFSIWRHCITHVHFDISESVRTNNVSLHHLGSAIQRCDQAEDSLKMSLSANSKKHQRLTSPNHGSQTKTPVGFWWVPNKNSSRFLILSNILIVQFNIYCHAQGTKKNKKCPWDRVCNCLHSLNVLYHHHSQLFRWRSWENQVTLYTILSFSEIRLNLKSQRLVLAINHHDTWNNKCLWHTYKFFNYGIYLGTWACHYWTNRLIDETSIFFWAIFTVIQVGVWWYKELKP